MTDTPNQASVSPMAMAKGMRIARDLMENHVRQFETHMVVQIEENLALQAEVERLQKENDDLTKKVAALQKIALRGGTEAVIEDAPESTPAVAAKPEITEASITNGD